MWNKWRMFNHNKWWYSLTTVEIIHQCNNSNNNTGNQFTASQLMVSHLLVSQFMVNRWCMEASQQMVRHPLIVSYEYLILFHDIFH